MFFFFQKKKQHSQKEIYYIMTRLMLTVQAMPFQRALQHATYPLVLLGQDVQPKIVFLFIKTRAWIECLEKKKKMQKDCGLFWSELSCPRLRAVVNADEWRRDDGRRGRPCLNLATTVHSLLPPSPPHPIPPFPYLPSFLAGRLIMVSLALNVRRLL